jgi:hypothetical protein
MRASGRGEPPVQAFDDGGVTAAIPGLIAMFSGHASPCSLAPETGSPTGRR